MASIIKDEHSECWHVVDDDGATLIAPGIKSLKAAEKILANYLDVVAGLNRERAARGLPPIGSDDASANN